MDKTFHLINPQTFNFLSAFNMYLPTFTKTPQISKNNKFCRLNQAANSTERIWERFPGRKHPIPLPSVRIREHHTNPCVHEKPRFGAAGITWGVSECSGHINLSNQHKPLQLYNIFTSHFSMHTHKLAIFTSHVDIKNLRFRS